MSIISMDRSQLLYILSIIWNGIEYNSLGGDILRLLDMETITVMDM